MKAALHASLQATHALAADAREDARQALRKVDRLTEEEGSWREEVAAVRATVLGIKDATAPLHSVVEAMRQEVSARGHGRET